MAKSKVDPNRKEKVKQFKQSQKRKMQNQDEVLQIPPVREVPVWSSHQNIEMTGLEFQAIFNYINGVQGAYGALQSIMNKNILNGNVKMSFEKLNEDRTAYVPMSDEEQKPHVEQFETMLSALREQAQKIVNDSVVPDSQEGVPVLDGIVDQNGLAISSGK